MEISVADFAQSSSAITKLLSLKEIVAISL